MSGNTILERGIEIAKQACEEDNNKNWKEAKNLYLTAVEWLIKAQKHEKNPTSKKMIARKIEEYLSRAEAIKEFLSDSSEKPVAEGGDGGGKDDDGADKQLRAALEGAVIHSTGVTFADVAGLDDAKQALQEAVLVPLEIPEFFHGGRTPWRGILLYGPPGTGKSFIAKAIATEANNSCFISVSSSDLVSKWQGQSEKMVKMMFEMARERAPCIIFIDEVDSLCRARSDEESESSRRIKTEFLVQMQGVGNDNQGVLIVGATNTPWELDAAIRRRFEKRIYIPLPDHQARIAMFKLHMKKITHSLNDGDLKWLADHSEGYSGADISTVCRDAIMAPVRKTTAATHFRENSEGEYEPCSPGAQGATEMNWRQVKERGFKLAELPVSRRDLEHALSRTKPTLTHKDLDKIHEFAHEFGQDQ